MMSKQARCKMVVSVGPMLKNPLRDMLREINFMDKTVSVVWEESKGWLNKDFYITITGDTADVKRVSRNLDATFKAME